MKSLDELRLEMKKLFSFFFFHDLTCVSVVKGGHFQITRKHSLICHQGEVFQVVFKNPSSSWLAGLNYLCTICLFFTSINSEPI